MGNDKAQKRKVQIISAITLFVFLIDIYLIIYVPTDYILATAAFVTFVCTIFTISSWFKLKEIENNRREEQYTDIMKAEKGTYVVTLEMLKEMNEKINFIGQKIMPLGKAGDENQRKIASMLDSIVEDQKKIAKITISRSKENADALMNSNDQLLNQMTAFRDSMEVIRDQVSKQLEMSGQGNGDIGEIKKELFDKIQELTDSIKKEVDEISENIEISNQSVENLVSANKMAMQKEKAVHRMEPTMPEAIVNESAMPEAIAEEPTITEEPAIAEEAVIAEEPSIDEIIAQGITEEPAMAEEIAEEPVISQVMTQEEPIIPETIEIDNDAISELIMEKKPLDDAEFIGESPVEKAKSGLDMSDPNKPMSPEDIAALIANSVTENLPEEAVKFEEEEKPPVPDMSDPNKPMSPEDIAALIANM